MNGNVDGNTLNARLELQAYAANHRSELVDSERRCPANLISVNYRSARLRVPENSRSSVWSEGQRLVLNLGIACGQGLTENLSCLVRWVVGDDLAVDFASPLTIGVNDLQSWLDN
jgi:hypothetical protein